VPLLYDLGHPLGIEWSIIKQINEKAFEESLRLAIYNDFK